MAPPAAATWYPLFALPGLQVGEVYEVRGFSLRPFDDAVVTAVLAKDRNAKKLFTSFTTVQGTPLRPAVICYDTAASGKADLEAVVAFRNCIFLAAVVNGWALAGKKNVVLSTVRYSDHFDLYPGTISLRGDLSWITPTTSGTLDLRHFRGQCSPEIPEPGHFHLAIDDVLLQPLLRAWTAKYADGRSERWLTRLFRSLEMAYSACRVPHQNKGRPADWGLVGALWVSAFETLTHNGRSSSKELVIQCLDAFPWSDVRLRARRRVREGQQKGGKPRYKLESRVGRLYRALNAARNDLLHGNPLHPTGASHRVRCRPMWFVAPLMFRAAVLQVLHARGMRALPKRGNQALLYLFFQRDYEEPLLPPRPEPL